MKFIKSNKPQQEESYVSYKCCANNCPLNGPISTMQDKWVCSFHFRSEPDKWPMVTETIRNNVHLFGILDDLKKLSEIDWTIQIKDQPPQRDLYLSLFDDNPQLKPYSDEKKIHYEYRLMDYIAQQAGVLAKKKKQSFIKTQSLTQFHNPSEFF